jgi:hypothetical protein
MIQEGETNKAEETKSEQGNAGESVAQKGNRVTCGFEEGGRGTSNLPPALIPDPVLHGPAKCCLYYERQG